MEILQELENQIKQMQKYPPLLQQEINSKPKLGLTLSVSKGLDGLVHQMNNMKATSSSFFISSNRQWNVKIPTKDDIKKFQDACIANNLTREQFLPHAPYLINVCSVRDDVREKSQMRLLIDAAIARMYGFDRINFHPGSTENKQLGIKQVAEQCNRIIKIVPDIILVLETMPGTTKVCNTFQECKQVIDLIEDKSRIGVCIDTQHCWAGGFTSQKDYGVNLFKDFDKVVGMKYLKGVHFNNSKKEYNSNVDRHESIEHGLIPIKELKDVIQLQINQPICLETPDEDLWKGEVALMFKWWNEKSK